MLQEQQPRRNTDERVQQLLTIGTTRPMWLLPLLMSVIVAAVVAIPLYLFIGFVVLRAASFAALIKIPWLLIGVGLLFLVVALLVFFGRKPLALLLYLRKVNKEQKESRALYTPLKALTNIHRTAEGQGKVEEHISLLDLSREQRIHRLILGVPGAGKTMALRVYQYEAAQNPLSVVLHRGRIPIFVPMKNYGLFLEQQEEEQETSLLDYLVESDLPGIRTLAPYLRELARSGRLLLLCDGLNELDRNYQSAVSRELAGWMRETGNCIVMTCREIDYKGQSEFKLLVESGQAELATIHPLQPEQVREFVERYVKTQSEWHHSDDEIMEVIDRSRLRYHCTNPMMLVTLMEIIDQIGVERGKQVDTRGRLLREWVRQVIVKEQRRWQHNAPDEQKFIQMLAIIACAARCDHNRNALQLGVSVGNGRGISMTQSADELVFWLADHPPHGPFEPDNETFESLDRDEVELCLRFATSANLLDISQKGILSFRHELIAEYFVAEYFCMATDERRIAHAQLREDLLKDLSLWSEPVAIWAGLLKDPLVLAECFAAAGLKNVRYIYQGLVLALVCVGVLWTPPQAENRRPVHLTTSIENALVTVVRNKNSREAVAGILKRCVEEGGDEVYRSLLPLISYEGIDELLVLLDRNLVPDLLFTYLLDMVDSSPREMVLRIARVLGRFGSIVVERAIRLADPGNKTLLREAAADILGRTRDPHAVEPLIQLLYDTEIQVVNRAANGLLRLGHDLSLSRLIAVIENTALPSDRQIAPEIHALAHEAVLKILERYLMEQNVYKQLTRRQYLQVLECIFRVLTAPYEKEHKVQTLACAILIRLGRDTQGVGARDNRWEKVLEAAVDGLLQSEVGQKDQVLMHHSQYILQHLGSLATPHLLKRLKNATEQERIRIVEVLKAVRDQRALTTLLRLVADPSWQVYTAVEEALCAYAPESIPGVLDIVLRHQREDIAQRAIRILVMIGEPVVTPIIDILFNIVPGRTRLLVETLALVRDPRAVSPLLTLLQSSQQDTQLMVGIIHALSCFPEQRVVAPLLKLLQDPEVRIREEASTSLSVLGPLALPDLVVALEEPHDPSFIERVQRTILMMSPFPGEELLEALRVGSDLRAERIRSIFKKQGGEAASVLVRHLLHEDQRVRLYVYQTLQGMEGRDVVPALIEVFHLPNFQRLVTPLLLKHPDVSIGLLVNQLADDEQGEAAARLLPAFGPDILEALLVGFEHQQEVANERAREVVSVLVQESSDPQGIVWRLVKLFPHTQGSKARDKLHLLLTEDLAEISLPALLQGLEQALLQADCAVALVTLAYNPRYQQQVLESLIQALFIEERRRGAAQALIELKDYATEEVAELLTAQGPVALVAQDILAKIGIPALPALWKRITNQREPAMRYAALEAFQKIPNRVVAGELLSLLSSDETPKMVMGMFFLLERVWEEEKNHEAEMLHTLIQYVQEHEDSRANARVMATLLLAGEQQVATHLLDVLNNEDPRRYRPLAYLFLLMGRRSQFLLEDAFTSPETVEELRPELAALLGLSVAPTEIAHLAQDLSSYGVFDAQGTLRDPQGLEVALRALGGLLAGGTWNVQRLQELLQSSGPNEPEYELFAVLLGRRFMPQLARLKRELAAERDARRREREQREQADVEMSQKIDALMDELAKLRVEYEESQAESEKKEQALRKAQLKVRDLEDQVEHLARRCEQQKNQLEEMLRGSVPSNKGKQGKAQ
ncbi:hypothetical protein KTH_39880 [Thermosporothrix hazakensis]|nr:hypothetical protein KTH_39880 [Thermosporothrix hazakensis]